MKRSGFVARRGSSLLAATHGAIPAEHVLLVGLGKHEEEGLHAWRMAGAVTAKEGGRVWADEAIFMLPPDQQTESVVGAVAEGALLNAYRFTRYRSNDKAKGTGCAPSSSDGPRRDGARRSRARSGTPDSRRRRCAWPGTW